MGRNKKLVKRDKFVAIWCTADEKEKLIHKAKMCGLPTGVFLRNLALEYPLKSMVDQYAIEQLLKAKADLGRLGGLFKLWLTKNEDIRAGLGSRSFESIDELVDEIESKQNELIEIAKKLMEL